MPAQTYNTKNGVKPRYDGHGTEFGAMHRDLGPGMLMFDVDGMRVNVEAELVMRNQDTVFVEYRLDNSNVRFVAIFELKRDKTQNTIKALDTRNDANSIARSYMAKTLCARLFVVFATNGKQPFEFYEKDTDTGEHKKCGVLYYEHGNEQDRTEKSKAFWKDVLKITRY